MHGFCSRGSSPSLEARVAPPPLPSRLHLLTSPPQPRFSSSLVASWAWAHARTSDGCLGLIALWCPQLTNSPCCPVTGQSLSLSPDVWSTLRLAGFVVRMHPASRQVLGSPVALPGLWGCCLDAPARGWSPQAARWHCPGKCRGSRARSSPGCWPPSRHRPLTRPGHPQVP